MKLRSSLMLGLTVFAFAKAYTQQPATPAQKIENALQQRAAMLESSLVKNLPFQNIGPTIMSGRVVDVDVNPENSTEFYVGYATGGVWYTNNNGTTFTSVFDNAPTQNVGDIAIDWKRGTIWVGTGETISSRSSYAGVGMLKSIDQGKTWTNVGLVDGHHVSDIILNPANPDEVIVGVLGHLYSTNPERGVFKTTDGGATWNKTLFVSDKTGVISVVEAPDNNQVLYAAAWDRDRKAWDFQGAGSESGIYKSIDRGTTWRLISKGTAFPEGNGVGRIGLAVADQNTVYAVHDNQERRPVDNKKNTSETDLTPEDFKTMGLVQFKSLDEKALSTYLKSQRFPKEYTAAMVKKEVASGGLSPKDLYTYVTDENSVRYDSEVIGAEVYRTDDGGASWRKTHQGYIEDFFYSYGYVFAEITVSPHNKDHIYMIGVPLIKSKDGGKTFTYINKPNVHVDHHVVWVDPHLPGHIINGNDGGLNVSYDDMETWTKINSMPLGQFYAINVDHEEPYNVYGGFQDNGTWKGSSTYTFSRDWEASGEYPYKRIGGGDGMQVQIDSRNANIVYVGSQFGFYSRLNLETDKRTFIRPSHKVGESPYRFNWQTPILLSPHNQDILYLGANKLMRSMNQGDDWTAISPDLTTGGKKGNVPFGTLTTISESPFQFGLIYTGSDDGKIQVTKNGGGDWQDISAGLPKDLWVSRVVASEHKKERVYATLNGYRWDDFNVYVYVSDDYGQSWKNISGNIPMAPVNVIVEDPKKDNIIYVGTDNGAYVSMDNGGTYHAFAKAETDNTLAPLPAVAIHDMKIQKKANHLLLGTHGRSIYRTDITPIQQMNLVQKAQLFDVASQRYSSRWGSSWSAWRAAFEPQVTIPYFVNKDATYELVIKDKEGKALKRMEIDGEKGINMATYDLTISEKGKKALEKADKELEIKPAQNGKYYLPKGTYTVALEGASVEGVTTTLEIK